MKRLSLALIFTLFCLAGFGQELVIKYFKESTFDLAASTNIRNDANDNPCALIKVQLALSGVKFEGNVIGNVERNVSEYWVYMSAGSKRLKIMHPDYVNCNITFADYDINSLKPKTTYDLVLLRPEYGNINVTAASSSAKTQAPAKQDSTAVDLGLSDKLVARDVGATSPEEYGNINVTATSSSAKSQAPARRDSRAVDLGLSVKWASCNVGATRPEEYGDYFAWGETRPKAEYSRETYQWCKSSESTQTNFTISKYGTADHKTTIDLEDDAAHFNWGGAWRMPTEAEQDELRTKCKWTWTTKNNVKGHIVTGPNGNSIFLPAGGYRDGSSFNNTGSRGYYWSSSLYSNYSNYSYSLNFYSGNVDENISYRYSGRNVRPVCQ